MHKEERRGRNHRQGIHQMIIRMTDEVKEGMNAKINNKTTQIKTQQY
jgi:hypothetical protein